MLKKLAILKDTYFCFFAILFVSLAIIGGFRSYSPVPFWDMWNGYLDFYTKVSSGDWSAWWAQHNEHRIVLARIFFWLDIRYLHGQGWLLIVVNYLLLSISTAVFLIVGKKLLDPKEDRYLLWFLVAWMFFWSQHENLTWGFQSQFFLAVLLPLLSIILLWQSHQSKESGTLYFILSLLTGIACNGSMANGVLALPLVFIYSLILKVSWRRSLILFVSSILCIWLYFHGYQSPSGHGSLIAAIRTDCFGIIRYAARYIGSPFTAVISSNSFKTFSEALGFFVLFFIGYQLIANYIKQKTESLNFALLIFAAYVIFTASVTGGGRLIFGLDQAFTSRYTTPAIMVWSAVFLILAQSLKSKRKLMVVALGGILLCMLPEQLKTIKNKTSDLTERSLAGLSLALNLEDDEQIKFILPSAKWGLELSKVPREKGYSIFGYGEISKLSFLIANENQPPARSSKTLCSGRVDRLKILNEKYNIISGWLFDRGGYIGNIYIADKNNKLIGVGFVGFERADVEVNSGESAKNTGFKAYMLSGYGLNDFLYVITDKTDCWIKNLSL